MLNAPKPCYKKCHITRHEAKEALKRLNRDKGWHNKGDVYYCEQCSHYHITSWDKGRCRDLKKAKLK